MFVIRKANVILNSFQIINIEFSFHNNNLKTVIFDILGLITGPALKRFRPRVVLAIGSFLSGFGLILSSMSKQLWQLTIAYGLVGTVILPSTIR